VSATVKDPAGLIIHRGEVVSGRIKTGEKVALQVDASKRRATALNHTATHILHAVLRRVLGEHVKQAGSLVAPDRLRFDFTHFSQVPADTLDEIEMLVNRRIRENIPSEVEEMDAEDAFKTGATALFEEKYGDRVRVVSLTDFSKELCGGTHTARTGDIGLFRIMSESSVAAGVRRIEAVTGDAALEYTQQLTRALLETAHRLKEKPQAVPQRSAKLLADLKAQEREIERLKSQLGAAGATDAREQVRTVDGVNVLARKVAVDNPARLRELADQYKDKLKSGIVVLGSASGPKALLIAVVTPDLTARFHAGEIVKQAAAVVGGSGGGRADMAQAGGTRPEKLDEALDKVLELVGGNSVKRDKR
jgi:alanyl-tRNA synthetase